MKTTAPATSLQLTISPTTVFYNAGQGIQDTVDLIMTIENTGAQPVQITRAAILLPSNLYAAGSLTSIVPVAPSTLWLFTAQATAGAFAASPASGTSIALQAGSSISFSLQSVTIAKATVITQVTILVKLSDGTSVQQTPSVSLQPGQPGINFFFPQPANINPGQTSTLSWETTGMDYCMIAPGNLRVGASGSLELSPETTTVYTLTAYTAGTHVTQQATISVGLPAIIQFGVEGPTAVPYGSSVTLIWECSAFTQSIELISDNDDLIIPSNLSPGPGPITTVVGPVNKKTTFQLTPYGYGDVSYNSQSLLITLIPLSATFSASPNTNVWQQDQVTISWDIVSASTVTVAPLLPGGPSVANPVGSLVIQPDTNVNYTLTVTSGPTINPVVKNISFDVTPVFTGTPNPITPSDMNEIVLQWKFIPANGETQIQLLTGSTILFIEKLYGDGSGPPVTFNYTVYAPANGSVYTLTMGPPDTPPLKTMHITVVNQQEQ